MVDDQDARMALADYVAVLNEELARLEPRKSRAHVLRTLIALGELSARVLDALAREELPLRLIATLLDVRDLAREEQDWVATDRDNTPDEDVTDRLNSYRRHMARVEATAMVAMAYMGSEREESDGAWGQQVGKLVMEAAAIAPTLMDLQADS